MTSALARTATLTPWIFCRLNVSALLDSALLLGRKVKVYWPLEEAWFAGSITDHCSTSLKHKVAALLLFLHKAQACASQAVWELLENATHCTGAGMSGLLAGMTALQELD